MDTGWQIKKLHRLIVNSATYRQSSRISPELYARDPYNRLLARAPRFRLPAWMLRDGALRSSGLLNAAVGGPPVRPHQPAGVWEEIFMGRFTYEPSEGAAQHRRSLYAFWRRSIAPTFLFDTAQRRVCEVRTPRTNTPLQALVTMNDPVYIEAAQALARRLTGNGGVTDAEKARYAFRLVLARPPSESELTMLVKLHDDARTLTAADWIHRNLA